jgi:glutamyl-Q tRNA(Asp) synthetase
MKPAFRFAPSPNGRLHLGHAYSAWLNAHLARQISGRFLVRMEDIDTTRCTAELTQQCLNDLAWLGLEWELPVRIQSQHFADYADAFQRLEACGLMYPCFCSRKQIAAASHGCDPDGAPLYTRRCYGMTESEIAARIAAGEPYAWRLDMPKALAQYIKPLQYRRFAADMLVEETVPANPALWGDVVLVRKETPTSYHLSVVVDDALQGITHVVRGQDLEATTDLHVLLQALLGLPTPRYHHHALLADDDGKLSKSRNSESLADLQARGETAEKLIKRFQ